MQRDEDGPVRGAALVSRFFNYQNELGTRYWCRKNNTKLGTLSMDYSETIELLAHLKQSVNALSAGFSLPLPELFTMLSLMAYCATPAQKAQVFGCLGRVKEETGFMRLLFSEPTPKLREFSKMKEIHRVLNLAGNVVNSGRDFRFLKLWARFFILPSAPNLSPPSKLPKSFPIDTTSKGRTCIKPSHTFVVGVASDRASCSIISGRRVFASLWFESYTERQLQQGSILEMNRWRLKTVRFINEVSHPIDMREIWWMEGMDQDTAIKLGHKRAKQVIKDFKDNIESPYTFGVSNRSATLAAKDMQRAELKLLKHAVFYRLPSIFSYDTDISRLKALLQLNESALCEDKETVTVDPEVKDRGKPDIPS
ncbi:MAG: hypothetical protein Q9227_009539 [Pyrenula ochraceoflavens]